MDTWDSWVRRICRLEKQMADVQKRLVIDEEKIAMAVKTLDDVLAETTKQTTVVGSAVTMIQGLTAQLKAALASNDPTKVQAALDAIDANTTALANAVAAGTGVP